MQGIDLRFSKFHVVVVTDDVVRDREALCTARLSGEDAACLFLGLGVSRQQAAKLRLLAAIDDQYPIDVVSKRRFDEQRHHDHDVVAICRLHLSPGFLLNSWVQDGLKPFSGSIICKHDLTHRRTIESPFAVNYVIAKLGANLCKGGGARLHDLSRDDVCVDNGGTMFSEKICHRGLAAGDATGQPDSNWPCA